MPLSNHILGPVVRPLKVPWPRWAIVTSGPGVFGAVKGFLPEGCPRPGLWGGLIKVWQTSAVSLVGPIMGGSQALMVLEFLKAAGVTDFLFLGTAGALKSKHPADQPAEAALGDIFLPTGFLGPSPAELAPYRALDGLAAPSHTGPLSAWLPGAASGLVWSRLAPFQATGEMVRAQRLRGALAVDLECAYLAGGAAFLALNWAPILLISDELGPERWRPGPRNPDFRRALYRAAAAAVAYLKHSRAVSNIKPVL